LPCFSVGGGHDGLAVALEEKVLFSAINLPTGFKARKKRVVKEKKVKAREEVLVLMRCLSAVWDSGCGVGALKSKEETTWAGVSFSALSCQVGARYYKRLLTSMD
jgi:hypothetical protein